MGCPRAIEAERVGPDSDEARDLKAQPASRAWAEQVYRQMLDFRRMTLREKIDAIEGMVEVVRRISPKKVIR
jgi:hypothetical protein